jgi:hypothetical protein
MSDNYYLDKNKKSLNGWIYIFLLFLSFIWISLYPATNSLVYTYYLGFGNLFNFSNPNFSFFVIQIIFQALIGWISFEIIFYIYRIVLSFRVYSFIVPSEALKAESRTFFVYRNLFYGVFVNLCFIYPFLYSYLGLINLVVSMTVLLLFSKHLSEKYGESIIGHFVFKNFCYPIFIYEAIVLILQIMGVA